jgi:hypothetical protein
MNATQWILVLLAQGCDQKTWHGPNLKHSLKDYLGRAGILALDRIVTTSGNLRLHAAHWKYVVRRKREGASVDPLL